MMMSILLLLLFIVIIIISITSSSPPRVYFLCPSVWAAHAFNYALLDDYYYFQVYAGTLYFIKLHIIYTCVYKLMLFGRAHHAIVVGGDE